MKFTKKLTALASCAVMAASMVGSMPAYATSTVDTNEVIAEHHIDLSAFSEDGINSVNSPNPLTGILFHKVNNNKATWLSCVYAMYTYNGPYTALPSVVENAYSTVCNAPYSPNTLVGIADVESVLNYLVSGYGYSTSRWNSLSNATIKNKIDNELPIFVRCTGSNSNDVKDFLITGYIQTANSFSIYCMDFTANYGNNLTPYVYTGSTTQIGGYTWSKAITMS